MSDGEMTDPRGRFLASLNHEVRTPLSGILGMADLLLETRLDEEQREYVQSARVCAESLLELLNATLEYSALSSDDVVLDDSEFALLELLENVASEFESKAAAKGLRLIRIFSSDMPETVHGDALRLRQILSHLMANAVKFTHRGYIQIAASAQPLGNREFILRLMVSDTGIGISPDHLHSVFESFRQLDSGLSRRYGGLGLGLSLAQKITTLMNGKLEVVSKVDEGSRFHVDIPLRLPVDSRVSSTPGAAGAHRILVVEDNPVAQTITTQVLRRRGYDVDCAASGKDALAAVSTMVYDLILMDLQLPDMDGFQTAAEIRAIGHYTTVPIVALTANASSLCRDSCARNGLNGYLTKPVRAQELIAAIERHLNRKRMPVTIAAHPDYGNVA